MYLLDTNVCIGLLRGTLPNVSAALAERGPSEFRLCSVVKAELLYGTRKSVHEARNTRLLERLFSRISSLPFDDDAAVCYAGIRTRLERSGTRISPNDMMIAAIAIANDAVLVTRNVREFERVVGLNFEAWG